MTKVKLLLGWGADLREKSREGITARDRAQIAGEEEVMLYLEEMMRERVLNFERLELSDAEEDE